MFELETVNGPNGEIPYKICQYLHMIGESAYVPGDKLRFKDLESKHEGLNILNITALPYDNDDFSKENLCNLFAKYHLQICCSKSKYNLDQEEDKIKLQKDLEDLFYAGIGDYKNKLTNYTIVENTHHSFTIDLKLAEDNGDIENLTEIEIIESKFQKKFWDEFMNRIISEGVCYSYNKMPKKLRESLKKNIDQLASKSPVDYHPNSNEVICDLVHPALYPYIKGVSKFKKGCTPQENCVGETKEDFWGRPYEDSKFQWLPTPFQISDGGKCMIKEYINNLDENEFSPLYKDLEELFELFLPYFEEVWNYVKSIRFYKDKYTAEDLEIDKATEINLTLHHENPRNIFMQSLESVWSYVNPLRFFQNSNETVTKADIEASKVNTEVPKSSFFFENRPGDEAMDLSLLRQDFHDTENFDIGSVIPKENLFPNQVKREEKILHGRELQVIVKIVDYTLQPEQEYEGVWHAEGMSHENIVMTGIYFIHRDVDMKGGDLKFKRAFTNKERNTVFSSVPQVRPISFDEFANEGFVPLGHFPTEEGYMLVFPNCHIHKIGKLINKASNKTSSRRIIVFFVINPDRKIISTREIAPQQDIISLKQAKEYRLELMAERKYDKEKLNVRDIELCEH